MKLVIPAEKSIGQLLYDLGFKYLCDGRKAFEAKKLDWKIVENHLIKNRNLNYPIYVNKQGKRERNFLTHPGVFIPPNFYYFFKEAKYRPDKNTFVVIISVVKSVAEGMRPDIGHEKEMLVETIRSSIAELSGGIFEKRYRAIDSVSQAHTICE